MPPRRADAASSATASTASRLRQRLPDGHRHPRRPAARLHHLRALHRRLRRGDGQDRQAARPDRLRHPRRRRARARRRRPGRRSGGAILRPRVLLYTVLWSGIGVALVAALVLRTDMSVAVDPVRNPINVTLSDGSIRNAYELRLRNMTGYDRDFRLSAVADAPLALELQGAAGPRRHRAGQRHAAPAHLPDQRRRQPGQRRAADAGRPWSPRTPARGSQAPRGDGVPRAAAAMSTARTGPDRPRGCADRARLLPAVPHPQHRPDVVGAIGTFSGLVGPRQLRRQPEIRPRCAPRSCALGWTVELDHADDVLRLAHHRRRTAASSGRAALAVTIGRPTTTRDDQALVARVDTRRLCRAPPTSRPVAGASRSRRPPPTAPPSTRAATSCVRP